MKLKPLADRIVIKQAQGLEKTKGGIFLPETAQEKPLEGEVLAVGRGKKKEDGTIIPLSLKVGDKILYGRYSGTEITLDGEKLIIMKEDEVLAVIN